MRKTASLPFANHAALRLAFLILFAHSGNPGNGQSLLWKISGNGSIKASYLYGTIHLTDRNVFEWKDSVYAVLDRCEAFAGEIDLSMGNLIKAAGLLILPEGQTLTDRFSKEDYQMVKEAVKSCSGLDLALFDRLKPPALVSLCFSQKKPGDLEATVDELLYLRAAESGKVTHGIESVEEQAALLDKIPDQYVLNYFKNLDQQQEEFEMLIRTYRNADLDSIELLITEEESGAMLNDELVRVRNHRMAERIIPMILKQSFFIAIGSGHLPGSEGLIALLRNEGFEVEPVTLQVSQHFMQVLP